MSSRRLIILITFLVLLSVANVFVSSSIMSSRVHNRTPLTGGEYAALVERLMLDVKDSYVDDVEVEKLFHGAVRGMLGSLNDPNSAFIEPSAYTQLQEDTRGRFGGLGIVIGIRDGYLTVISVMEGHPAGRAGVESGERIFSIDGKTTLGLDAERAVEQLRAGVEPNVVKDQLGISLPEAVSRLRGPVGEPVVISVGSSEDEARELEIVREQIDMESVADVKMVDDGIGYLRLTNFAERTPALLDEAVGSLKEQGMESLVLDLRNNPGGLLHTAVQVAERFIPEGELIVSIRGRGDERFDQFSRGGAPLYKFPLAVLVNEYSASGSEIVAAALQDLDRGVIVGQKTHGKGSVQSIISVRDGSGIKLTTSRYHSPADRVIDKVGVEPDVAVKLSEEDFEEYAENDFVIDAQLKQAISILKAHYILSGMSN